MLSLSIYLLKLFGKLEKGSLGPSRCTTNFVFFCPFMFSSHLPNGWTNSWVKIRRLLEHMMEDSWIHWTSELLFRLTYSTLLNTLKAITFVSSQPTHTHTNTYARLPHYMCCQAVIPHVLVCSFRSNPDGFANDSPSWINAPQPFLISFSSSCSPHPILFVLHPPPPSYSIYSLHALTCCHIVIMAAPGGRWYMNRCICADFTVTASL